MPKEILIWQEPTKGYQGKVFDRIAEIFIFMETHNPTAQWPVWHCENDGTWFTSSPNEPVWRTTALTHFIPREKVPSEVRALALLLG